MTVSARDGYQVLKALLPPKERRGVILIDPPFEAPGELERLADALAEGVRRFATGVFMLWYPIKDGDQIRAFKRGLAATGLAKLTCLEMMVRAPRDPRLLNGTGMVILNPPYGLEDAVGLIMPVLCERLAREGPGGWSFEWLTTK